MRSGAGGFVEKKKTGHNDKKLCFFIIADLIDFASKKC